MVCNSCHIIIHIAAPARLWCPRSGAAVSHENMIAPRNTALLLLCTLCCFQANAQIPATRFDEGPTEGLGLTPLGQGLQLLSAFLRPPAEDGGRLGDTLLRLPGARRRERRTARRDAAGQVLEGALVLTWPRGHPPGPMLHHMQVHDALLHMQVQQRWVAAPHRLPLTLAAAQPWRNPCWQPWRRPWPAAPSCSPNHPHHQPQPLQ